MTYIYNPTEGGGSGTDKFLSSLGFNTGTGLLTATMNDSATRTVDLDGRYLEQVFEDPTPQLGGDLDLNSNDITGTGNINITGAGTLSGNLTVDTNTLYVDSSVNKVGIGTTTLAEALTVNGAVEAENFIGGLIGEVQFKAKAGEDITKGDPLYISGVSGTTPIVNIADADDANKMPAFGLAENTVSNNAALRVVTFGTLPSIDTSSFSLGDILYISTSGTLTATKPTGESSLVQNIGIVQRVHASSGSIKVGGAGRTNDIPNLDDGNVFIGNGSNVPEARALTLDDISETSSNKHFTASDNTKLDGIATGAEVNVKSNWNETDSGDDSFIQNKPTTITSAEQTKLSHITVTQAVDLDTMESNVTTNNAKVTNATHSGDVTGSGALTIANEAVTNAKMAHLATGTVKARTSAGTGDVEDIAIATTFKTALSLVKGDVGLGNVSNTDTTNASNISSGTLAEARLPSIDADNTTISDLTVTNLKSGVLDTDLASVSASHDTLASAKAIKDYVDARVQYALDNATQYFG